MAQRQNAHLFEGRLGRICSIAPKNSNIAASGTVALLRLDNAFSSAMTDDKSRWKIPARNAVKEY
jgi:hypothetical protein